MHRLTAVALAVIVAATVAADVPRLTFREMYSLGIEFSARTQELEGTRVRMEGFMAPPLKPDARFFVLTRVPMAVCPFCDSAAAWPDDIVYVEIRSALEAVRFNLLIEVEGRLSLGEAIDPDTGFVSLLRLEDAVFRVKR